MLLWGLFDNGVRIGYGTAHKDKLERAVAGFKADGADVRRITIKQYETAAPSRFDLMRLVVIDALANPDKSAYAIRMIAELYNIEPDKAENGGFE